MTGATIWLIGWMFTDALLAALKQPPKHLGHTFLLILIWPAMLGSVMADKLGD